MAESIAQKLIAEKAGVSRTTVSVVLNNRPTPVISEKTRRRVLKVAQSMGYRPRPKIAFPTGTHNLGIFIGRGPLEDLRQRADKRRFVGLLLEDKGVLRNHMKVVVDGVGEGEITSGGFSPTIGRSIARARVPAGDYDRAQVDVRGKLLNVRVVKTPFVRNGTIRIDV